MPPKGLLWEFFIEGDKQNTSHFKAHCLGPAKRYGCCTGSQAVVAEMRAGCLQPAKFFPCSLALLFGGDVTKPEKKPQPKQFTWEALMMELLAAEESDEAPDDGALSGSGD
ncbi:hypothetical protein B0H13DRAFT_1903274 [Mycena leptocephala]|nr:hypothetical protein B0H13DRAFT_1903274 [Mycena leptocephala]